MEIIQNFMTNSYYYSKNVKGTDTRYTAFQRTGPKGLMLHSVGCNQPDALACIAHWNTVSFTNAAVHAFIDAETFKVYQAMPWNFRAPHCGGSANDTHLGVEMCEPPASVIRYVNPEHSAEVKVIDKEKAVAYVKSAYKTAVELFADLCIQFNLNPLAPGVIISHSEGYKLGVASNHADPEHLWKAVGVAYTMDTFRAAVQAEVRRIKTGNPSGWAKTAADWATAAGLIKGDADGNFRWKEPITREELAVVLHRFFDLLKG